jgi:hypothetical protein
VDGSKRMWSKFKRLKKRERMKLKINYNFINCFKKLFKIYIEEWNRKKNQFKKFTKKN